MARATTNSTLTYQDHDLTFLVEMRRYDINNCIGSDIENNSRSGIVDNVPDP